MSLISLPEDDCYRSNLEIQRLILGYFQWNVAYKVKKIVNEVQVKM